jgi:hypothetical protein
VNSIFWSESYDESEDLEKVTPHTLPGERLVLALALNEINDVLINHREDFIGNMVLPEVLPDIVYDTLDMGDPGNKTMFIMPSQCTDRMIMMVNSRTIITFQMTAMLFTRILTEFDDTALMRGDLDGARAEVRRIFNERPELGVHLAYILQYQFGDLDVESDDFTMQIYPVIYKDEEDLFISLYYALITFMVAHEVAHVILPETPFSQEFAADYFATEVMLKASGLGGTDNGMLVISAPIVLSLMHATDWLNEFLETGVTPPPFVLSQYGVESLESVAAAGVQPTALERMLVLAATVRELYDVEQSVLDLGPVLAYGMMDSVAPALVDIYTLKPDDGEEQDR